MDLLYWGAIGVTVMYGIVAFAVVLLRFMDLITFTQSYHNWCVRHSITSYNDEVTHFDVSIVYLICFGVSHTLDIFFGKSALIFVLAIATTLILLFILFANWFVKGFR